MTTFHRRAWRLKAAGAAAGAVTILAAMSGTASAAASRGTSDPDGNLLLNGNFHKPGAARHEGVIPNSWTLVDLGAETAPYSASFGAYNQNGQYPPPAGNPDPSDVAGELFYEAGSATGVEGVAGQQRWPRFGEITQDNDPQVSFSDVENFGPQAKVANWAGSGVEIVFSHGGHLYRLIYLDPWTAAGTAPFPSSPASTQTTKYILGPTLTKDAWYTQPPRDLSSDIDQQFQIETYQVEAVRVVDLEETTNSGYPYPNMDGYFADVSIAEGGPGS